MAIRSLLTLLLVAALVLTVSAGSRRLLSDSKSTSSHEVDPKKVDKNVGDIMNAVEGPVIDIVNNIAKMYPKQTKRLTNAAQGHHTTGGHHQTASKSQPVDLTKETKKVFGAIKKPVTQLTKNVVTTVQANKKAAKKSAPKTKH